MDPLSIIGGISATGGIIAAIVKTLKQLSDARGKFENADTTIQLLMTELITIKGSVDQIQQWSTYMAQNSGQKELIEAFKISFEGCKIAMDALAEDITGLSSNNPFFTRAKYTWNEVAMKDHADRLRSQVADLNLLIQAVRW